MLFRFSYQQNYIFQMSTFRGSGQCASDSKLVFKVSVSQVEWKFPKDDNIVPILILWEVKNITKKRIVLPIGTQASLELTDGNGKAVPGGVSSNGNVPFSYQDYRPLKGGWTTYVIAGDFGLYSENKQIYIGGNTARGGWVQYGPLNLGKYLLRCKFSTEGDPSAYAKKLVREEELWLGTFTSEPVEIELK